jgi:isocitrate dehydrogenase (NAD+)
MVLIRTVVDLTAARVEVEDTGLGVPTAHLIDATAMQLVMNPWQFDVIVTTNLFGDILSDQLAGLVGGLGMAPGANIGPDAAIFEAVHGSAPDIAGKGIANPLALLLAVGLMLEHIDRPELANRLRAAIDQVLRKDGIRTPDLGGKASTTDFTLGIIHRINQQVASCN